MSQYRAYPAYKDSGIEWIGQVPEHWQVKRLKHLISQCQNGVWGDDPLEDGSDTLCIRVADFDRDNNVVIYNPSTYRQITKEHQDSRLVSKGDILLEKSGGGAQTLVGANVRYLGEEPAVCSNFVAVIKPSKMAESAWLNYLMASMYALKINLRSIKQSTGIQNLDSEQYLDEGVAAPSLDEQATIAAALDRETARIDALVEKKTRFIELLKEKRQALITHAVTKGLDPNVKMKDSGIEWIGQVPEHWKIAQIKRISALNPRKSTLSEEKDSLCTFLPMEKLRTNAVTLDETRPIHEVYGGYSYFSDGDILIAKVTPCFENGNIAVANGLVNGIGFGSTEINVLRVNGKGHNRFLYYRLQEEQFRTIAKSEMRGTGGLKRVPTDLFESFTIGLPDTDEQATIAATLDRETARIDTLIGKAEQSITLLKERRAAFITAAVTGQIDLRGKQ
ncbi:TPA: restriction endonuclease subunit S [Klebsiella pneumoniae]|nr:MULTISPECIES: restriction endonuclease subunit S [Gammaproteobacteria]BBA63915.1 type I restriction enzyme specificity protein [Escherichia coli]HDU3835770.1 restriction endonuclease subunit S [Klebsiella aerogenes]HDU6249477.1 restriction endonuclease subunit S [Klebsiella pneumoniae subsp. ozaenae]KSW94388.1 hypothetical protein APT74_18395 [Klebsiella pneumoniae]MCD1435360.1 restriction endonuclease subunit S [Klebsiella pneumoniae]